MQAVSASLLTAAPSDDQPTDDAAQRRRRLVVGAGLLAGTTLLAVSFIVAHDNATFYSLTLALATTWIVAGLLSGPIPLRAGLRQGGPASVTGSLLVTVLVVAVFLAGALIVREIAPLRDYVSDVLSHAHTGSIAVILVVTVANAIAEEVFFRGALYAALGGVYPVAISTLVYAAATAATGNPMLIIAALMLGVPLALQRRSSAGILAPIVTHVVWSVTMLFALSALFPN